MKTWVIIATISIIIWAIVPIFYRSNKHFYYFLLLAATDITSFLINHFFHVSAQILWIPFTYFIVLTFNRDFFLKYKILILGGLLIAILAGIYSTNIFQMYFVLISHIILFVLFSRIFISIYLNKNRIDIFYIIMVFFEALTVFKIIAFLRQLSSGLNIYFATNILQILIGLFLIYLSIKRKNNRNLEGNRVLFE
ncbi:MAG: hypothetical protein WAR79_05880 [Melioribacteraceae bacterium]